MQEVPFDGFKAVYDLRHSSKVEDSRYSLEYFPASWRLLPEKTGYNIEKWRMSGCIRRVSVGFVHQDVIPTNLCSKQWG